MPKNLPIAIIAEKNKLNMDEPWLAFLHLSGDGFTDLYFVNNTDDVTWQGQLYTAFPFKLGVQKYSNTGKIPSLDLQVSNVRRVLQPHIDALDGLMGMQVTISIVSHALLSDPHTELSVDLEIISTVSNDQWVTFSLGTPNPLRQRFPLYVFIANTCNWVKHFKGAECKLVHADTTCKGTLEQCELYGNTANFGGHPGLNPDGIRVVR